MTSKDEMTIEKEIQQKGLTGPRITPQHIDRCIKREQYYIFPGTLLTACCLTLQNGYNVVGISGVASAENFDEEIGRKIAREKARDQIWALEGYLLKEKMKD